MTDSLAKNSKTIDSKEQKRRPRRRTFLYLCTVILTCAIIGLFVFQAIPSPDRPGWRNRPKDARIQHEKDQAEFEKANKAIKRFIKKHKRLPTDEEGQALVEGRYRDHSYSQIRYEKTDSYRYGFRTDGFDGIIWSSDDIRISHMAEKSSIQNPLPQPVFETFVEAEKGIESSGSWARNSAIQWFIDAKKEIGTQHKSQIIAKVLKHPEQEVFDHVDHKDHKLIECYLPEFNKLYQRSVANDAIDLKRYRVLRSVIVFWVNSGDKFSFKKYVNLGIEEIEGEIKTGLVKFSISNDELASWCLRDLKKETHVSSALTRLATIELSSEKEEHCRSKIFEVLSRRPPKKRITSFQEFLNSKSFSRQTLNAIVGRFADESNLEELIAWIRNEPEYAREVLGSLTQKRDKRIYRKLVSVMGEDSRLAGSVYSALLKSSHNFEDVLLEVITRREGNQQVRVCRLLAICGTEVGHRILNKLEASSENTEVQEAARDASQRIKRRLSLIENK